MYATAQDVVDRYGSELLESLLPIDATSGEPDTARLDQALADAGALINGALRGRYTLPLATTPGELVRICVDLALAQLPTDGAGDAELIDRRAKAARRDLESYARGVLTLDVEEARPAPASGGVVIQGDSSFRAKLEDF
ncbi:MAG: gp436 family protein [Desulfovibrionaceae bacterium]